MTADEIKKLRYSQKIVQCWYNLEAKFIPQKAWESDLLTLWRERITFILFFLAVVLGPFALIPSLILSYNEGLWGVFILDSAAYLITLVVFFSKKFSLKHKTWIIFFIFYLLGVLLLSMLGFQGAGYIWLFGASLIVGAMLGLKAAGIALLMNFLSLVSIGIYIAVGSPEWAFNIKNIIEKWVVMIANFMLINTLITLLVAVMLDSLKNALTREENAAIELKKKREELMAIFAASPDPLLVYDSLGNVQYLNDAFTATFGWILNEVKGRKISFIPEGQQKISDKDCLTGPDKIKDTAVRFETKRQTKDGKVLDVSLSAAPIKGNKGEKIGIVANIKDITKSKKIAIQLQQSQKMESIGTLAGGIAHDFNNILFPIVGYTEMLLEDIPEDSPFRESLNQIYTSALRARSLVKQILSFSRQESSELILMKMQPIVKESLKLIRSTIPTTIDIKLDINPDCGVIKADPTQIHQIVMNLATNAYHAMEEIGGELKVSLKEVELGEYDIITPDMAPGIYACLTVADTGKGMDKTLTDKIFDPFFTTKEKGKGTGMGLSVVHGIVTAMGGAIQVYSEPGEGTQFHVYLPVEKSLFEEQVTTSKAQIQGGIEQILLVDDEQAILKMEKRMLERLGYQVTSRTSSLEALEAFRASPDRFDLVITDMAMPNMSGDGLSVELTKIRPGISILLCTGFSENMSDKRAASLGIKGFLFKPIVMKDLAQKIREVLE